MGPHARPPPVDDIEAPRHNPGNSSNPNVYGSEIPNVRAEKTSTDLHGNAETLLGLHY